MPKKRANGQGSIRERKNGLWEARITVLDKSKSIYGKTKAEVRKNMTALMAQCDRGEYVEPSEMTLTQWSKIWLESYTTGLRDSTIAQYSMYTNRHVLPAIGGRQISKLTPHQIQRMYNGLLKNVAPKTVRNIHGILHKMLQKAVKLGYITRNPTDACELPKVKQKSIKPIVDDKLPIFLEKIQTNKYGKLYFVAVFTGMRLGEILGLTWDCIDFKRGTITLYRQLTKVRGGHGQYAFGPLKTRQDRFFKPAPQVLQTLKCIKAEQSEWKLKCSQQWGNHDELVFTHEDGKHLCSDSVYGCFKRIVKQIGMPDARFHDLRHTFCTLAVQSGTDFKTISETVGHATVAFTQDRYGHVSDAMMDKASENMSRLINSI